MLCRMMKRKHPKGMAGFLMLNMMEDRPMYGYEILEELKEISGGYWDPSYGTVYGALQRFEDKGWIKRVETAHEDRKYFGLTEAGREHLDQIRKDREERLKKVRDMALGFLNVYRNMCGEEELQKLLDEIEREFDSVL